ncbi:MAG TPA: NUDIX domain-containing protein [Allosphingosinicella sp.]|nr:NUDIX domain-containing protein [Allosphingosinicella sp.]
MPDLPEPIPAATLVLMRERPGGPPELLVTERTGQMAFAAGALVFPGGRIDADDHLTAETLATDAAKVAAIRETIEETGLAPGLTPPPDAATVAALREGIADEEPFASLLAAHGLAIDGAALTPFARWCPNFRETRRFDTLFFLAEAPADAPEPQVSAHEAVRAFWASAAEILAEVEAGRAHVIFPTRRNLERLARFGSIAAARADAAAHPVATITPWVEARGGAPHVCIPEGIGYPVTSEPLETARRR